MSQSLAQLWIHIIFSTKNRHSFLKDPDIRKNLHDYIKAYCDNSGCKARILGGTEDHVHLLTNLNKTMSLVDFIEKIKKSSSRWIKKFSTENRYLGQFYWQRGYGAFSVSESNIDRVKRYIENQHQHHQKYSFQEELRKFLVQHNVSYKEEYIWD